MFSLFSPITETKVPEGTKFIIFKPNKEQQIIIIKGKFGQFKIILDASLKFNQIPLEQYKNIDKKLNQINEFSDLDNSNFNTLLINCENKELFVQKYNDVQTYHSKIFVQYNIDENKFLNFSKKHLIYNKKTKLLQDRSFLYSNDKTKLFQTGSQLKDL
jgi:hypothetical protein